MDSKKLLSALSYFSIFFAGFLFPLIVYLISYDQDVKGHAKKALFSHLIPLIPVPFILFTVFFELSEFQSGVPILFILSIIFTIITSLVVVIWNIIKGIQVLSKETI